MTAFTHLIDRFIAVTGRALAWLTVAMVLVTVLVVVMRYVFGMGSIALQEAITYLHASVFLLGVAYTLQRGGHVRVDIFYRRFSDRGRAWVDALGTIVFLLPLCAYLVGSSWDYVAASWRIREGSADAGIPAVYLLKTLVPTMAVLLALQGLAELFKTAAVLCGKAPAAATQPQSGAL